MGISRRVLGCLAFGLLVCGCLIALNRCDRGQTVAPLRPAALPQDPDIQIYFNQNPAAGYRDLDRLIDRPGDDLERVLLEAIESARLRIDIAVYELRLPRIARALVAKQRAGVRVRVVTDNDNNRSIRELDPQGAAANTAAKGEQEGSDPRGSSSASSDKFDYAKRHYEGLAALVDQNGDGQLSEAEVAERDAIAILRQGNLPPVDDTEQTRRTKSTGKTRRAAGSSLMHHKFMVIDGRRVITGSANFTPSDIHGDRNEPESRGNANHLLSIESRAVADAFETEFAQLWGDGPGKKSSHFGQGKTPRSAQVFQVGSSKVTLGFGPRAKGDRAKYGHGNQLIASQLKLARRRIDLALFVFSEPSLTRTLAQQQGNGVEIRALIDADFAFRPYSQALPMLGVASCGAWPEPLNSIGVPQLPPGDRLHHKLALLDDRILLTGSHNWSFAADRRNDETLLAIDNPMIAAHARREFDRLYRNAALGIPARLQQSPPTVKQPLSCDLDR
jgi:phosphatidylserine/phosphatidylglycerophosphate/cardiolipin synthase-like enzyme